MASQDASQDAHAVPVPQAPWLYPLVTFATMDQMKKLGCLDETCTYAGQQGKGIVCVCAGGWVWVCWGRAAG